MNGSQLQSAVMSILARAKAGMEVIKVDCATKGVSSYHQELTILGDAEDFHVLTLALNGAINFIRTASDGGDFLAEVQTETRVTFVICTVRVVAQFDPETHEISFVFTDRKDEAGKAQQVAEQQLTRIMELM